MVECIDAYICTVRKAVAIVLFVSVMIQCVAQLAVKWQWSVHQDYIAKNLCENRTRPKMKCDGKCYLRKAIDKSTEQNSPANDKVAKVFKIEMAVMPPSVKVWGILCMEEMTAPSFGSLYHGWYSSGYLSAIFRPPTCV